RNFCVIFSIFSYSFLLKRRMFADFDSTCASSSSRWWTKNAIKFFISIVTNRVLIHFSREHYVVSTINLHEKLLYLAYELFISFADDRTSHALIAHEIFSRPALYYFVNYRPSVCMISEDISRQP
uniref:Maturase K n=1 Tax=Parascaris univalens TaxID=6257 RepID=A0A915BW95_PARUN